MNRKSFIMTAVKPRLKIRFEQRNWLTKFYKMDHIEALHQYFSIFSTIF